ncbi:MAG: HAD family hydrolase [Acidobacteria bacterium]|nr:HAD family hydrolase [Acidobacteriota bacterium]
MHENLARPWDEFDAYLFDIDGTLIHCTDAVHYFAFCDVLSSTAGHALNLDGVTAHGNTDIGILRDAFAHAGVAEDIWRPQLPQLLERMCGFVDEKRDELCTTVLPQVKEVLLHLRERGAKLGVATGNLERIGKRKLQTAGLIQMFDFGGWSDSFESREDVFRAALNRAHSLTSPEAAILVIGDTPADVKAAKRNQLPIMAVATGIYSFEELSGCDPNVCVRSFQDLLPVV